MSLPSETLNLRKDELIERLSSQYALNILTVEEYERLIEYAHKIETPREFSILEMIIERSEAPGLAGQEEDLDRLESQTQSEYTILSTRKSDGSILKSANRQIVCIMGNHHITIEESDLVKARTELNLRVVMGEITIRVPANVAVSSKITPIMGEVKVRANPSAATGVKKLVLTGTVIMGNVTVKSKGDGILKKISDALNGE